MIRKYCPFQNLQGHLHLQFLPTVLISEQKNLRWNQNAHRTLIAGLKISRHEFQFLLPCSILCAFTCTDDGALVT